MKKSNVSALSFLMAAIIGLTFCISPALAENPSVVLDSGQSADLRGTPDRTPPVLKNIMIDKTEVDAPGTISITVEATDDVSGINEMWISFLDTKSGRSHFITIYADDNTEPKNIYTGLIQIGKNEPAGHFELDDITLYDMASNSQRYYSKIGEAHSEKDILLSQEIKFIVNNNAEISPPSLINVDVDKVSVEAPANIDIKVTASDYVNEVHLVFKNYQNGRLHSLRLYADDKSQNVFKGTIEIDKYEPTGIFILESAEVYDDSGEQAYYSRTEEFLPDGAEFLPQEVSYNVKNVFGLEPTVALSKIELERTDVEVPAKIQVKATVSESVQDVWLSFQSTTSNRSLHTILYRDEEHLGDTLIGTIDISDYEPTGIFYLARASVNGNVNGVVYFSKYYPYFSDDDLLLPQELSITVHNTEDIEGLLITNTDNPNLADDIAKQPNDARIIINYETDSNLSGDIFNAIKGTNKTIVLESEGIQWEFNGKDIESSKGIDLNVSIDKITSSLTGNAQNIQNIVKNVPTMVLSFADNGKLPGKATIRIKADYAFRNYVGEENLYVYYYDNTTGKLVSIAQNIDVSQEGYLLFEIDHNSDFIITQSAIQTGGDSPIIDNPIYRPSGSGGSSGGGSSGGSSGSSSRKSSPMLAIKQADISLNSKMTNAIKKAIRVAAIKGQKQAVAAVAITDLELSTARLQALQRSIQATLKGQNIEVIPKIVFSGIKGGQKKYSLSFNPLKAQITDILKLGLTQKEPIIQSLFEKHFTNHLNTVTFKQSKNFGFPVEVAVKMDFSGFDTKNLHIYHYDRVKNVYTLLADTNYFIDKDNFLHFTTISGGDIIISDGLLSRK